MTLYERGCPDCENIDKFTEKELSDLHFCQSCYYEYEALNIEENQARVFTMYQLLIDYKKSLEGIDKMIAKLGTSERDDLDRSMLNSMREDVALVIEWLKKGHDPDEYRGIDRRYSYHGFYIDSIETIPDLIDRTEREPLKLTSQQQRKLVRIFDSLSEREMDCFILHEGHRWSMQEVADELGISKSSVQMYVERARNKAGEVLKDGNIGD